MKLGLVAHRYHAGVLQMYVELCAAAGFDVVLYTSETIHRQLAQFAGGGPVRAARVVLDTGLSAPEFRRLVARESGAVDALVFVELQFIGPAEWRGFAALDFRCPVYAGVHDIVREPGLKPLPPWRVAARAYAKLRAEVFRGKIAGFIVHSKEIRARWAALVAPRPVCFVPVYFRDARFRREGARREGALRVGITGAYLERLRQYGRALAAFERALERGAEATLALPGWAHWREKHAFMSRFGAFAARHPGTLSWSSEKRPTDESEFRAALEGLDVLVAPVVRAPGPLAYWVPGGPRRRAYAPDAHVTAATYDAIRFQLPILYPAHYMARSAAHPGALVFETWGELADRLVELARDRGLLEKLTRDMIGYAANFTPERFVQPFRDLLGG